MRLVLTLLVAGAVSLLAGLAASKIATLMPCQGEGLACNLNDAIGAYAVLIWTPLSTVIFGMILYIACNRVALLSGTILLLAPLIAAYGIAMFEAWRYVGFYPYKDLRTFLVALAAPALTVVAQTLILGSQLTAQRSLSAAGNRVP